MTIRLLVIFATLTVIGWAIWQSKRATPIAK
jgi:predicted negative regulator of RcsB-dependent stress response